jgi:hypothetical protein
LSAPRDRFLAAICGADDALSNNGAFLITRDGTPVEIRADLTALAPSSAAATFTLKAADLAAIQQIVVQKAGGQVAVLAMPKPDTLKPAPPTLKDHDPIPLKSPSIVIAGTLLAGIQSVTCKKGDQQFSLVATPAPDGNSVTIQLPDALTSDPQVIEFSFNFKDDTVLSYSLKVTR